jgi:O-antigen/teichoic acid export membrane protein
LFKTSLIYFLIRAINGVLSVGTIYVLTRILSAEQYGLYALGIASILVCATVLFQWIAVTVSRFYGAHLTEPNILLAEALRLFAVVAVISLVATACLAFWSQLLSTPPLLVLSVGVGAVAMGLYNLGLQIANVKGEPNRYGLLTASRGALALIFAVCFVRLGFGGIGAVFASALASIASVTFFGTRYQGNRRHTNSNLRRQIIAYGLPLTLSYLAIMVVDMSDRFMIAGWMGASSVSGYAAAYDLTQQTIGATLNVFFLVCYPRITVEWEAGGALRARQAMIPLSKAMLLVAPLLAGLFVGLATNITQLVLGSAVQPEAAQVMPWIAVAIAIASIKVYYLDVALQLAKGTRLQLGITVIMAVLNVVLNVILIPRLGVVGAAISTTAAFSSGAILSWWFGRRWGVFPDRKRDAMNMTLVFAAVVFSIYWVSTDSHAGIVGTLLRIFAGLTGYVAAIVITNHAEIRAGFWRKLKSNLINIK